MSSFRISIKRVFRNFAANAFGQAMNGVYQFISVPLFLHYWSKEGYGEWLVLFSIPSLLWSLEGGLAGVASNRMTVAASAGSCCADSNARPEHGARAKRPGHRP